MKLRTVLSAAFACVLTASAFGQTLKVGDQAPGLDIEKWVKGKETSLESGKVYVVEFWATWCGPCKKSIPHLTELQKRYEDKGLTVIGISDEDTSLVNKFVKGQGTKMDYTVAVDRRKSTYNTWMSAANRQGIPCAFIVDQKGKIAFIGNPHPQANEGFDQTLAKVVTGRYDSELSAQADPVLNAARQARKLRNWKLASKHYDDVLTVNPQVFANVGVEKFEMMLVDMNDRDAAYEYARNGLINKHFASDAESLEMLASKIASDPAIEKANRDLDVALEAAEAARKLAGPNDPAALASEAEVRYQRGEVATAINLQKQAYFYAPERQKPEYKRVLSDYQGASERAAMNAKK